MVTMNGLDDTRPRRIRQNTPILSTRRLYSPKLWDACEPANKGLVPCGFLTLQGGLTLHQAEQLGPGEMQQELL